MLLYIQCILHRLTRALLCVCVFFNFKFFDPALMALPSSHTSLKPKEKKTYRKEPYKEPTACPGFNGQADAPQQQ